eukprot:CAMPEP_0177753902 /NCGR_PEP_ID=MMETSP0491_2-20121128/1720_1 /TAXON_ID=63592 /ORGANISM="Tetraselmis chuii, Strain PLY429" /LENGTH=758 /DNA_ID=CAMNT_0019269243 /DNA_START=535 /DNA_END=2811 /DNA_ORIENTATION=-
MTTARAKSGDELLALRDEDTLYNCGLRDGSKLRLLVADHEPLLERSTSSMSENSNNCGAPSTPSPKTRNISRCRDEGGSGKRLVDSASSTQKACIISPNAARILSPITGVMPSWSPSTFGHRPLPSPDWGGYGFEHQQHQGPEVLDLRLNHDVFGGGAMDELSRPTGKRIVDYASSTHQKACIISPNAGVLASWSPSTYGHRPPSPAGGGYGFEQQQHEEPEMLNLSHHHNVFGGGAMDDESSRLTGSLVSRKAHQRLGLSPQETNTSCALPKLETVSLATGPSPDCFLDYWVMSSRHSQYSRGAVSACTGLSLEAAAAMLALGSEGQTQPHRPFGCSLELLERILEEGSTYRGSAHEDLPSVLKRRQDLVEQGLQHINGSAASGGMVDVDPQQPYRGLVLGQRMAQDRGQLIAGVFTCQAQSIAMFFLPSSPDVFLFDSHSRADGSGPPAGAAFRFFSCLRDMCAYISILFRLEVDEPLDDMEANQLAIMSVGQVDFLSLEPIPSAAEEIRAAERNSVSQIDTRESDEEGKECGPQQRSPLKVDPAASDSDPVKMYHQEQYIDMRKELDAERRKRICAERKLAELSARLVHAQDAAPDARHQNLVARSQALETELEKERKRAADLGAQVGTLHRELARLHTTYGTAYGGTDTPWRHTRNETRRCALGSPSGDGEQVRQHQKQTEQDQELFLADIVVARNLQMEEEAAHAAVQRNRAIAFQLAAEMENAGERDGRGTGPDRTVRDERSRARNRRQFGK